METFLIVGAKYHLSNSTYIYESLETARIGGSAFKERGLIKTEDRFVLLEVLKSNDPLKHCWVKVLRFAEADMLIGWIKCYPDSFLSD